MALSTKRLYYRHNNQTYSVSLYDSIADVETHHIAVTDENNAILYAWLDEPNTGDASHIHVHASDITWAIWYAAPAPFVASAVYQELFTSDDPLEEQ